MRGWMGLTVGLDGLGEKKNLFPLKGFESRTVQLVA
jgi:hypothetical protein